MASHQQDHALFEQDNCYYAAIRAMFEQQNATIRAMFEHHNAAIMAMFEQQNAVIRAMFEQQNVPLKNMEGSINQVPVHLENFNPLLPRTSALPSNTSSLPHQPESSTASFQLCFKYEGNFPDFLTKTNIEDVIPSLTVELCDHTEKRVEVAGLEFYFKDLKVKFLVLDGDSKDVVTPRHDKGPLLKGNSEVSLSNGSARVCGFSFTDNSSTTAKNGKFRLGAQLINGSGWIVRAAVSPPFQVKDIRKKSYLKHKTPKPGDELYRLDNISPKGEIYRRAKEHDLYTVMDFLQLYHTDENELLSFCYPNQTPGNKWKVTVDNAKKCDLSKERYKYEYLDDESGDVILLKCDFQIESVTLKDQAGQPYESLFDFRKEKVNRLRKAAYKKRRELKKVYDSTSQTLVRAGSGYPSYMDPNAVDPLQHIPAVNHDNGQQDMGQYTALGVGTNPSGASEEFSWFDDDMLDAFVSVPVACQGTGISGEHVADRTVSYDFNMGETSRGDTVPRISVNYIRGQKIGHDWLSHSLDCRLIEEHIWGILRFIQSVIISFMQLVIISFIPLVNCCWSAWNKTFPSSREAKDEMSPDFFGCVCHHHPRVCNQNTIKGRRGQKFGPKSGRGAGAGRAGPGKSCPSPHFSGQKGGFFMPNSSPKKTTQTQQKIILFIFIFIFSFLVNKFERAMFDHL